MMRSILSALLVLLWSVTTSRGADEAGADAVAEAAGESPADGPAATEAPAPRFYVVPIQGQIGQPTVFIVRNGVKEAVDADADYVVLHMDTPGGELGATLEIMEILDRFKGTVVTYVDREAGSAGAIIAGVTDDIFFAPKGVIGAAEPILSTGEDVSEGLKRKMTAYLAAKVDAFSEGRKFRAEVLRAMMDPNYELVIDGNVIKTKDELLMLTATKAMKRYGDPPQPLLGAGIHDTLDELITALAGEGAAPVVKRFQMTWSVELAQWLMKISPLLLGLGGMLLFIEFKTPGFGVFGISGIILLLLVFFGHNVAGLSGHEPMLLFLLGVVLVFVELLFFPGVLVFAIVGLVSMIVGLLWGMADVWPGEAFELTPEMFVTPAYNLALGLFLAVGLIAIVARLLPRSLFWDRFVLRSAVGGTARREPGAAEAGGEPSKAGGADVGSVGVVVTDLHPVGRVEIDGRRYEARAAVGEIPAGRKIRVVKRGDFVLIVEPADK